MAATTDGRLPATIRAYTVATPGAPAAWRDVPCPQPGLDEVLVRVAVASINPVDRAIAAGNLHDQPPYRYPVTLGRDYAGTVVAVGAEVTRFTVGDEVFGCVPLARPVVHAGSFAQYVAVSHDVAIAHRPATLARPDAAALPLAGAAALTAVAAGGARAGTVLLVAGATGGVGRYAVALAVHAGATVIATGRPCDESSLRALGAALVVDFDADVATAVRARYPGGIDGLVHLVTPPADFPALAALVRPGGRIATTVHAADVGVLAERGIAATNVRTPDAPEVVAQLGRHAVNGVLTPKIDYVFEAARIGDGLALLARGPVRGKFVVTIS